MRNLGHYSFFIILLLLCGRPVCSAQSPGTGAISGAVLDPDGLPIKGASITLTRDGTHSNIVAVTGTNGAFAFPLLTPATYTLKAEASGFAGGELSKVEVAVGEVRLAHFQLRPAAVQESVDVSAESLDIAQTESSTLGRVVTQRAVEELPLSTRNFTQILSLSPGVSVSVPDATQVGRGTQNVSADGNKTVANNIQFNGVDANNLAQLGKKRERRGWSSGPRPGYYPRVQGPNGQLRCGLRSRVRRECRCYLEIWFQLSAR